MLYAKEGPHKAGSSLLYVCMCVCVLQTHKVVHSRPKMESLGLDI